MWNQYKRKTPKTEHQKLIEKADKVFSKYIRFKDGAQHVRCCTCGKILPSAEADAGHYISREYMSLRYDERNVWPQCKYCNRFKQGMSDEYALFLQRKFGKDILEELDKIKQIDKRNPQRFTEDELWEMIKGWKI